MWGNSIASRVKKLIKQRVQEAQHEHDVLAQELSQDLSDSKLRAEEQRRNTVEAAYTYYERTLEDHALKMVLKIIGKL